MNVQRRWLCFTCEREWAYATTGDGVTCPTCRSVNIQRVEYLPVFQGADIRFTREEWAGAESTAPMAPVIERKDMIRDRNEALLWVDPYADQLSALLGVSI